MLQWEYEGKKIINHEQYTNSILTYKEYDYNYDGLHCTYKATGYSFPNVVNYEVSCDIEYLDNTYLRCPKQLYTTVYSDGRPPLTRYYVWDFDGKKPIGLLVYYNGEFCQVNREYQYNGLTCHYYRDMYQNGEVYTTSYEVEYLE